MDNYLLILQLASWLCYLVASEVESCINPWERYLPDQSPQQGERLTMSQSIRAAGGHFATLDLRTFKPPKPKKK